MEDGKRERSREGSHTENSQNPTRNYELDIDRLQEIEKMQKMLFDKTQPKQENLNLNAKYSNSSNTKPNLERNPKQKLIEHANFVHNFSEYNINPVDIISLYFIKHHPLNEDSNLSSDTNFIPVTTNVIKKDKDTIEITRVYLYNDYYNNKPYPSEKIVIKRNAKEKENLFISFLEDKMKKTISSLSADSIYTKVAKFKSFRTTQELLFYQNIFHYKCILDMYNYYKLMNKIPPKKELLLSNLYYHEFMKNLL